MRKRKRRRDGRLGKRNAKGKRKRRKDNKGKGQGRVLYIPLIVQPLIAFNQLRVFSFIFHVQLFTRACLLISFQCSCFFHIVVQHSHTPSKQPHIIKVQNLLVLSLTTKVYQQKKGRGMRRICPEILLPKRPEDYMYLSIEAFQRSYISRKKGRQMWRICPEILLSKRPEDFMNVN